MNINGNNAFLNAYQGIQTGSQRLNNTAQQIANPNSTQQIDSLLISQRQDANQVQASTKALKTADDNIGNLIDILA